MKLRPKGAKFCLGCRGNELKLKKAPELIINTETNKNDTKIVTVTKNPVKKFIGGLF